MLSETRSVPGGDAPRHARGGFGPPETLEPDGWWGNPVVRDRIALLTCADSLGTAVGGTARDTPGGPGAR